MKLRGFIFKMICGLFKHGLTWFYAILGICVYNQPIEQFSVIGKESSLIIIVIFLGLSVIMTKIDDIHEDIKSSLPKKGE
jgi:hypothetical protein